MNGVLKFFSWFCEKRWKEELSWKNSLKKVHICQIKNIREGVISGMCGRKKYIRRVRGVQTKNVDTFVTQFIIKI